MFSLLILLGAALSTGIGYEAGNKYSYDFQSLSRIEATSEDGEVKGTMYGMTALTHFTCLFTDGEEALFEMTADTVRITHNLEGKISILGEKDANMAAIFLRPIHFKLNQNGDISDVLADAADDAEIVNIKTAMMELIRTPAQDQASTLDLDSQGMHYTHVEQDATEEGIDMVGFYTESDFVHHRDPTVPKRRIACSGEHTHSRRRGIVHSTTRRVSYSFSSGADKPSGNTESEGHVQMTSDGFSSLTMHEVVFGNAALDKESAFARLNGRPAVPHYSAEFYAEREEVEEEEDMGVFIPPCPSGVDLCKSYGLSFWAGNSSFGVELSGSVIGGTNKGCRQATRNFLAGAYLNLDLWILNSKFSMVEAYAEYGYVSGGAQRNGVAVKVFGYSLYSKTFPDLPCIMKSIPILDTSRTFAASFTVYVSVLPVTFSVGTTLGLKVTVPYKICLTTWDASVSITPVGTVKMFADVTASILLAKGGVRLEATVTETVDPTAYLSIGQCRVGIKATSYLSPLQAKFYGYVQVRDCSDWCNWGDMHTLMFWQWSSQAMTRQLFDYYYQV